jgi:hypothetical protein
MVQIIEDTAIPSCSESNTGPALDIHIREATHHYFKASSYHARINFVLYSIFTMIFFFVNSRTGLACGPTMMSVYRTKNWYGLDTDYMLRNKESFVYPPS